jgi:alcohol dehydrogenase
MPFDWLMPQKILFGAGRFDEIGALAAGFGMQLCLVTGGRSLKQSGRLDRLAEQFDARNLRWMHLRVEGEPTVETIDELTAEAAEFHPHLIVAVGGGSVLDAGKAVAALLANGGQCIDYLEGVGRGATPSAPALPVIAVPTTAGTGSEATKNAVIGDRARTFKKSMRSETMLPAVAVVDPELTYDCPPEVTAACGMDALTQLLEAYTSTRANPFSDTLACEGLKAAAALENLAGAGDQEPPRGAMALASLLGGICLANVGLGAVHGLVSPLGAMFPVPHGAGCAALLAAVVRMNTRRARENGLTDLGRKYAHAARQLDVLIPAEASNDWDRADRLADHLRTLNELLAVSGLAHYGITRDDFPEIAAGARGNSMKTNPVELSDDDLTQILEESL